MEKIKLGEICDIVSGSTPKTNVDEYWDGNIDWITPAEISDSTFIVKESIRKITELAVLESGLKSFPKGTVILSSRAPIGKVAIAGKELYCNQGFKNLICSDKIYNYYLYWFLKGKSEYLNSLGRGATFKEISKSIVENIEIMLPPYEEQRERSEKIEKCWRIVNLRNGQLNYLDELIKSRFVEMFGDPVSNTKGWKTELVGNICFVTKLAGFEYTNYIHYQDQGDVIMIRGLNVKNQHLKLDDVYWINEAVSNMLPRSQLKENDVVMTYIGVNIGDVALVDGNNRYHLAPNVAKISPISFDELNPVFFVNLLAFNKQNFASNATNTAKQALNMEKIRKLKVMLPPVELQEQFAVFVQQVDKLKVEVQKSLDETQLLMDSLMQKYFG